MIRIREAREEDVGQIREIFLAVYGADYPHHEVYDELWLKRSVFTDDALILVATAVQDKLATRPLRL
jgi:hypothetical protein